MSVQAHKRQFSWVKNDNKTTVRKAGFTSKGGHFLGIISPDKTILR